jgi:hypothetical protein
MGVRAAIILLAATAALSTSAGTAAATSLHTHACPNPHIKRVAKLRAGLAPGGYPAYAADCGGAKDAAQTYVHSRCSRAGVMFRIRHGRYEACNDETDTCGLHRVFSRKRAQIVCVARLNPSALVLFNYVF